MITVIDYKAGNLTSVVKALRAVSAHVTVTEDPEVVRHAEKIVLPGVGHFAATEFLETRGIKAAIVERIAAGVPFLGVCVGLQWLFSGSTEAPGMPGLGTFDAVCERFAEGRKIPHVGWNSLSVRGDSRLLAAVPDGSFLYFTHSYRAPVTNGTVAVTEYGGPFTAAAEKGNVMGVQFHPEKSGVTGLRILRNFVELPC
ncbi:glutamine amidotransferase [Silvibacterium bohemicum]|uniref:Imidazole glycerol phosphate synthase subunit HisH n=1 Tax=Silvibacterium bohemicum TaxID=1577686 RepID=A0A841JZ20_9BACT|nr:imidazole glycerol phosphate synthase subunit HisH [Silvibacterium bohemicum]MBB6145647.1 glutamine amidotransferase [Silvibacterium bohemicum]